MTEVDPVSAAVERVLAEHPDLVRDMREARPKAWGRLAALGVVAYRERLGRPLDEAERRALWSALWRTAHRDTR